MKITIFGFDLLLRPASREETIFSGIFLSPGGVSSFYPGVVD